MTAPTSWSPSRTGNIPMGSWPIRSATSSQVSDCGQTRAAVVMISRARGSSARRLEDGTAAATA